MTLRSFAQKVLPRRLYCALAILKNGVPPDFTPSMIAPSAITRSEPESPSECARDPLPPSGTIVPSMVSGSEAEFFSECARGPLPPGGVIVDLGCFMGSTAIALARGLIESGRQEEVVAYDLFTWWEWMNGSLTYGAYRPGDCFLPEARRYARDHGGGLISLQQADLSQFEWDGRPIALLLVDAMKSFDVASQVAQSFYPALLPGAILIHQDFKHYYTSWIHVLQFRFREHFHFLHSVPEGGTVAFTVASPIPANEARAKSDLGAITDDEIEEAFNYSMGLVPRDQTTNVAAAHVMLYHHLGRDGRALETLATYRALGLGQQGEFPWMVRQYFPTAHHAARVA
jgi:hypothetical protein